MKLLFLILAILFLAVIATLYAVENPGYVLIARAPWSIEMTLTLFIPLLLLAFLLLAAALYVPARLFRIPRDVRRWRARRQTRHARSALIQGLIHLAEGNWTEAETEFLSGLRYSDTPLLDYLGAAYAAQELGLTEKRDEYLSAAHKSAPQNDLAIGMTQAYLQHLAHQPEQALATLMELRARLPKHAYTLKLLARVSVELRDWTGIIDLIPDLRQHGAVPASEIDALEMQAHRELLRQSLPSGSLAVLRKAWDTVPRHLHRHPALIAIYARQLIAQGEPGEAESVLRAAVEDEWNETLVELYGRAQGADAAEQLETAEGWLVAHPDEPMLFLTLGRLATRAGESAKARTYLEKCIALSGPAEAQRELGAHYERAGEKDKALGLYRRGLELYAAESRAGPGRLAGPTAPRYRALR